MSESTKDKIIFFMFGMFAGIVIASAVSVYLYKFVLPPLSGAPGELSDLAANGDQPAPVPAPAQSPRRDDFFVSFEQAEDLEFLVPEQASQYELTEQHTTHGGKALKLTLPAGAAYPGLLWEVYGGSTQNWKGTDVFHFDIFNDNQDSVKLVVKFKSGAGMPTASFEYPVELKPWSLNVIDIPISSIGSACDITQISYVKFFAVSPVKDLVLYFDNIGPRRNSGAEVKAPAEF